MSDESAYRNVESELAAWCTVSNLELNFNKTVEMIFDLEIKLLKYTVKFLGRTISRDLKLDTLITTIIKRTNQRMFFLRLLRKLNTSSHIQTSIEPL